MMKLVLSVGVERFLLELSTYVEEDFRRWERFDKVASSAAHSPDGVIELMPTSDGTAYGFKYVNGQAAEHGAGFLRPLKPKADRRPSGVSGCKAAVLLPASSVHPDR